MCAPPPSGLSSYTPKHSVAFSKWQEQTLEQASGEVEPAPRGAMVSRAGPGQEGRHRARGGGVSQLRSSHWWPVCSSPSAHPCQSERPLGLPQRASSLLLTQPAGTARAGLGSPWEPCPHLHPTSTLPGTPPTLAPHPSLLGPHSSADAQPEPGTWASPSLGALLVQEGQGPCGWNPT